MEVWYEKGRYATDFCIMEFIFTDAASLASDTQTIQIATMLFGKKEQKIQCNYGNINKVVIALAIGRCLQRSNAFSDYQGTTLQAFLQTGKCTNANDLDYVYSKANKP